MDTSNIVLSTPLAKKKEKMLSLQARISSFSKFKMTADTILHFALCGFYTHRSLDLTVSCFSCDVTLGEWEDDDSPFNEHYRRSPGCNLFNFRLLKHRIQSYPPTVENNTKRVYSKDGYFYYKIKNSEETLLCYMCGDIKVLISSNRNLQPHVCTKSKGTLWSRNFIMGKYTNVVRDLLKKRAIRKSTLKPVDINTLSALRPFVDTNDGSLNAKIVLKKALNSMCEYIETSIKRDINEIVSLIDKEMK